MSFCTLRRPLARVHEVKVSQRYTMAMQLRPVSPDLNLRWHLGILKLGELCQPFRPARVRQDKLPHADFSELPLSAEVSHRQNGWAARRARAAGLDPDIRPDTWDATAVFRYDQPL
jgi:hypothetical protein